MNELSISDIIEKANGDVITRFEDGSTYIKKADGAKIWTDEFGTVVRGETAGGEAFEVTRRIPWKLRPLNVYSKSEERIGRLLSIY